MFRIPNSVLTEEVILQPSEKNGLGGFVTDTPTTIRVSIRRKSKWKVQRSDSRAVGTRGSRVTSRSVVGLIMDTTEIISNVYVPIGSLLELPEGEVVEVKEVETLKFGRVRSGYKLECW